MERFASRFCIVRFYYREFDSKTLIKNVKALHKAKSDTIVAPESEDSTYDVIVDNTMKQRRKAKSKFCTLT